MEVINRLEVGRGCGCVGCLTSEVGRGYDPEEDDGSVLAQLLVVSLTTFLGSASPIFVIVPVPRRRWALKAAAFHADADASSEAFDSREAESGASAGYSALM